MSSGEGSGKMGRVKILYTVTLWFFVISLIVDWVIYAFSATYNVIIKPDTLSVLFTITAISALLLIYSALCDMCINQYTKKNNQSTDSNDKNTNITKTSEVVNLCSSPNHHTANDKLDYTKHNDSHTNDGK